MTTEPDFDEAGLNTRAKQSAYTVLQFLRAYPGVEFTRPQIAEGTRLNDDNALKKAISDARWAAAESGERIEHFMRSKDAARRGAYTLRFLPVGYEDKSGGRDALRSARSTITAMEDMQSVCDHESKNPCSTIPEAFGQAASTVQISLTAIAGINELHEKLWRTNEEKHEMARQLAEAQARLAAAGLAID
jgi:hypothetical protein